MGLWLGNASVSWSVMCPVIYDLKAVDQMGILIARVAMAVQSDRAHEMLRRRLDD